MIFDKVKTLRAAEKSLEMGKIPAAIKEYSKLVENDPDDFTTLNILGDLYVRVGNPSEAVSCFRKIAEHYREQEFALKAIAMFKKIDRLQPSDIEIANQLADLYAQQDLVVEARAHYLTVANAHTKSGNVQAGLEVLRKLADLDPQNTEVRIKLAEGYLKEGLIKEAAVSFTTAGHSFLMRSELDEALAVFAKAVKISPNDHAVLNGFLAVHTARGTADEAAEVIAAASASSPADIELLLLAANAYIEADDPEKAEAATEELIRKDATAYLHFLDVARLYLRSGSIDDAVRVAQGVCDQMLSQHEEQQLLELVNEFLVSDVDNVRALRLIVRIHWWQRDIAKLKSALERLAEAAQAAGLTTDERYALTQLTRLAPEDLQHLDRLQELGGPEEEAVAEVIAHIDLPLGCSSEPTACSDNLTQSTHSPVEPEFEYNSVVDVTAESQPSDTLDFERGFAFATTDGERLATTSDDTDDRSASMRAQELESVDFYIAQGYVDIAVDTLNLLERQFGAHADIERRRQQLSTMESGQAGAVSQPLATSPPPSDESHHASHVSTQDTTVGYKISQVIDPGLAEIFEEYRESAEAESNGNGDYETHYNLGLAYQEMDLFEEALEEFQIAVGLVSPEDGTPRYLQCCNLLGHCFLQKGVPQLAIKWFNQGLSCPANEDERQALRFDLAAAYEQAGELRRAIDLFTEIYGVNVSYRSVNERLRSLQSRIALQPGA